MNKLIDLLASGQKDLLAIYMTPGYPELQSTEPLLKGLGSYGADIIEVGIPYSDPLADGPTIQNSSRQSLNNGVNLKWILSVLLQLKSDISPPVVLMGYFNSILQYGIERFCRDSHKAGVSAVIIPDLPYEYFAIHFERYFQHYSIEVIYLISPATSDTRIKQIDKQSTAFIYAVSSASTTGSSAKSGVNKVFLDRLKNLNLKSPVLVGFNVKSHDDHYEICNYVRGSIIGSAFIRAITDVPNVEKAAQSFVYKIKN